MRLRKWVLVAAACAAAMPARSADDTRTVGTWVVITQEDRFGGGGSFYAMTGADGYGFAVRCIEKELSLGIMETTSDPKPLAKGDLFAVKLRVDKEPVVDLTGIAVSDRLIQISDATPKIAKSIRAGKESAVRVENAAGVSRIAIFKTRENDRALGRIFSECKIE